MFLLTREVSDRAGTLEMSVKLGRLEGGEAATTAEAAEQTDPSDVRQVAEDTGEGFAGFRVGIRGNFDDYRDSAVRGLGMNVGLSADGRLFIGTLAEDAPRLEGDQDGLEMRFEASPAGEAYRVTLTVSGRGGEAALTRDDIRPEWLTGGVALVSSSGPVADTPMDEQEVRETGWEGKKGTARGGSVRFWFDDWTVAGDKVDAHPDRSYGPILFAMHTLSRGTLNPDRAACSGRPDGAGRVARGAIGRGVEARSRDGDRRQCAHGAVHGGGLGRHGRHGLPGCLRG